MNWWHVLLTPFIIFAGAVLIHIIFKTAASAVFKAKEEHIRRLFNYGKEQGK